MYLILEVIDLNDKETRNKFDVILKHKKFGVLNIIVKENQMEL